MRWLCLLVLGLPAQEDVSSRLKREEWRAVQSLVEQGEASRSALAEAAKGTDPDVAFYAQAALSELDVLRAAEVRAVPRTRRTEGPAARIVTELFKSAGLHFAPDGLPERAVALPEGLTFAEAVDGASRALERELIRDEKGAWKAGGPYLKGPRFASGSVRANLVEASRGTAWKPGIPPKPYLWLEGHVESFGTFGAPYLYADFRVLEATDEHGRSLLRGKEWYRDGLKVESHGASRGSFTVPLQAPDVKTTRVARLRLAADFCFKRKIETITFENVSAARRVKKVVGDVEAILVKTRVEGNECHVQMTLAAPGIEARVAGAGAEDPDVRLPQLSADLLDAEGRAWEKKGGGCGVDSREYSFHVEYGRRGAVGLPATLSFSLVTEVEVRSLYFEFRDVALP